MSVADQVFHLSDNGILQKVTDRRILLEAPYLHHESEPSHAHQDGDAYEKQETSTGEANVAADDEDGGVERQRGDLSLWLYYLKSYGLVRISFWILWAGVTASMERLPGKEPDVSNHTV